MTTDQEMREYADKATSGPWEASQDDLTDAWDVVYDQEYRAWIATTSISSRHSSGAERDAAFVAASRDWVPDALDRLDRIRALIDPSKAVKGSVASKILQILDGDDQ